MTFAAFATPEEFGALAQKVGTFNLKELLKSGYEIVHHIKGRIRLRIRRLGYDGEYANLLSRMLNSVAGVTGVNINPQAKSVTMHYEEHTTAARMIESLIASTPKVVEVEVMPMSAPETSNSQTLDGFNPYPDEFQVILNRLAVILLEVMGTIFFGVGIVGLVVPFFPGIPFLILASVCLTAAAELSGI